MQTLGRSITDRMHSELNNAVETRVQKAILAAKDKLLSSKRELAMKSVNASSARNPESVILDPHQIDLSKNALGLQLTPSSRVNSNRDLTRINEICGNITVEAGELSGNERPANTQSSQSNIYKRKPPELLRHESGKQCTWSCTGKQCTGHRKPVSATRVKNLRWFSLNF